MKNDLTNSAFLHEKEDNSFYNAFFKSLKKEVSFEYGAIIYNENNKDVLNYEIKINPNFKKSRKDILLYIPIRIKNSALGNFLFIKKTEFTKEEKNYLKKECSAFSEKIKDFELSKIFKNQLSILQNAIIEKTTTTHELKEKNKHLIEIDKTRSEFLANVSHELRTPLNSIIGFSTALKDGMLGDLNEKQKIYANKILTSAIHLTGLINDILDMSKIESGEVKVNISKNNPVEIIKEVINIVEPLAEEKNIKIETDFKFSDDVQLDYIKFKQIIYNLLGNAIKFSHKNSNVKISTQKNGNIAVFTIQDYGVGIAKKDFKRIFEKFVQLDNIYTKSYSSTGLGLAITRELVKLQNGKIKIKSEVNKGSSFILEFNI